MSVFLLQQWLCWRHCAKKKSPKKKTLCLQSTETNTPMWLSIGVSDFRKQKIFICLWMIRYCCTVTTKQKFVYKCGAHDVEPIQLLRLLRSETKWKRHRKIANELFFLKSLACSIELLCVESAKWVIFLVFEVQADGTFSILCSIEYISEFEFAQFVQVLMWEV